MAVIRQENWLGNQRVDIPHLRSVESAVAGDFDLLAGAIMAGRAPTIISGFYVITTGITLATSLKIRVADSSLIHFLASESGSIFHVPASRPDEQLSSTNPRVVGSFTPDQVNYVGLDFVREADDSTIDLVEFLDSVSKLETPVDVPLGRTLDYRIHISTLDFDNNPGIAPVCKVTTNAGNDIVLIEDTREQMFRLGSGGTIPDISHSFPWPSGRKENTGGDVFVGGDKAIGSFKSWMDAVMSRLWDVGGGEYWYSPTTYANERLVRISPPGPFVSTGENFEWDGSDLHWKGLAWVFANSTAIDNPIQDQTTDLPGLTDLAEGDCIYTDVNRFTGVTVIAAKAALATLGSPDIPGSRYVIAWRYNDQIWTRDQSYNVGGAFKNATTAAAGMVKLSATPGTSSLPAWVATLDDIDFFLFGGGLSRGSDFVGGAGNIQIGGWTADDESVIIKTTRVQDETLVRGSGAFPANATAALKVVQTRAYNGIGGTNQDLMLNLVGTDEFSVETDLFHFENCGAMGWCSTNDTTPPTPPVPSAADKTRAKMFFRNNGVVSPGTKDQYCIMWFDGSVTVIAESPAY